jgi:hypothetical protein
LVCFGTGLVSVWYFLDAGARRQEDLFMGLLVALFCMPLIQLGSSVIGIGIVGLFFVDRASALRRIGIITLWSFGGALIGIALMGGFCGFFGLLR